MSDTPPPPSDEPDAGVPVSVRIRERIKQARERFHANDNIARFIEPGELEALHSEVEAKMLGVLNSLVIDTEGDHNTRETARRVAETAAGSHRASEGPEYSQRVPLPPTAPLRQGTQLWRPLRRLSGHRGSQRSSAPPAIL